MLYWDLGSYKLKNSWDGDDAKGEVLWLITPAEFEKLPDGAKLKCINGDYAIKGVHDIDDDTRFGLMAYGLVEYTL
jgi:hypothetical protein